MDNLDRIAEFNGTPTWVEFLKTAENDKVRFKIPNFMHYNNMSTYIHTTLFETIKEAGFKLIEESDDLFLVKVNADV